MNNWTFEVPDLGEGLTGAEIVQWHVALGEHVTVGQPLVAVETDKAVVEIPSPVSAVVAASHAGLSPRRRSRRNQQMAVDTGRP